MPGGGVTSYGARSVRARGDAAWSSIGTASAMRPVNTARAAARTDTGKRQSSRPMDGQYPAYTLALVVRRCRRLSNITPELGPWVW